MQSMSLKNFNNFLIRKWKWIVHVIKALLFQEILFVCGVEAFYHIELKSLV